MSIMKPSEATLTAEALEKRYSPIAGFRPRGVNRLAAAAYVGVSQSLFDEMVRDGRMPKPKLANTRVIWDTVALDAAFDDLPTKGSDNPWDAFFG